jgi:hypothetical protein
MSRVNDGAARSRGAKSAAKARAFVFDISGRSISESGLNLRFRLACNKNRLIRLLRPR